MFEMARIDTFEIVKHFLSIFIFKKFKTGHKK
jgi:hypothetical protein